ncbi:Elongation factor Ts [Geodia barretti]|uniref:Elongation factor Ts, mitochondrial n=1 Tax=Geodia barretti TaxID=519541 RepID=A0AA35RF49_GEOBA|nr:Elongation factor Ts [Geodia barretti]
MAQISAALVKQLRDKTGAGMMDCKKALTETDGELEAAVDWLRKSGLAQAARKAGRTAAEGLIGMATAPGKAAMVEINAETDFVARNADFQAVVREVARIALDCEGDLERLSAASYPGTDRTVGEEITNLVGTIGENIQLRRTVVLSTPAGVVGDYIHAGRRGVRSARRSLERPAHELAMHIAAASPQAVSRDSLDQTMVERERGVLAEQARAEGKPENIIEKMIEGRLRKFFEEVVLLEQTWVIDGETRVKSVLESLAAVSDFVRYQLGEGIERESKDFAAEVAAQLGS